MNAKNSDDTYPIGMHRNEKLQPLYHRSKLTAWLNQRSDDEKR